MAAQFGKLLYLTDHKEADDPYKGEVMVSRLGVMERPDCYYFEVPEDKRSLKLDECRFTFDLDVDSNYVPDNSLHAKIVRKLVVSMHDQRVFDSFDLNEYTFFNLAKIKLNESDDAQNLELFPSGHFDARELHSEGLVDEENALVRNGLSVVANRQQYSEKIWIRGKNMISFSTNPNAGQYDFERLINRYSVRAPIGHGIASQRRVIPAGTKTFFEVELNTAPNYLMQLDEYQTCRTAFQNFEAMQFPYHENLKLKTITVDHLEASDCDCVEKRKTGEYDFCEEIFETITGNLDTVENAEIYSKDLKDDGVTFKTWKKHRVTKKTPDIQALSVKSREHPDDPEKNVIYLEFGWKNILGTRQTPVMRNYMLQSVFVNAGKKELPLTTGQKGIACIPFFYQKFIAKPFPVGRHHDTITISTGVLPQMLWISGMSHQQYANPDYKTCTTKTTMNDPEFKIIEFTIFLDNKPAFRTPWRAPLDHYTNFVTMNGRLKNKGLGGGIDFFKFQDENWMVPLIFDDSECMTGTVDVAITFSKPTTRMWDLLVMAVPVEDLEIDMINKREFCRLIF